MKTCKCDHKRLRIWTCRTCIIYHMCYSSSKIVKKVFYISPAGWTVAHTLQRLQHKEQHSNLAKVFQRYVSSIYHHYHWKFNCADLHDQTWERHAITIANSNSWSYVLQHSRNLTLEHLPSRMGRPFLSSRIHLSITNKSFFESKSTPRPLFLVSRVDATQLYCLLPTVPLMAHFDIHCLHSHLHKSSGIEGYVPEPRTEGSKKIHTSFSTLGT